MWKYLVLKNEDGTEDRWHYMADANRGLQIIRTILFIIWGIVIVLAIAMYVYDRKDAFHSSLDDTITLSQTEAELRPLFNNEAEMIERIDQIVKEGGDLNGGLDDKGQTFLHIAASSGYNDAVELLFKNGANFNAIDADGISPVERAYLQRHSETWMLIYEHGGRIKGRD